MSPGKIFSQLTAWANRKRGGGESLALPDISAAVLEQAEPPQPGHVAIQQIYDDQLRQLMDPFGMTGPGN